MSMTTCAARIAVRIGLVWLLLWSAAAFADPPGVTRAPIVRVAVRVAESSPPLYFAEITSALPDGCSQLARIEVFEPEGERIVISVFNERTAPPDAACTQVYGEKESIVQLRGAFVAGTTYTLDVNGTLETFIAQ